MHAKTVHDCIAKPRLKSRNGWNSKGYKSTRGVKLKGAYVSRATPVILSCKYPRATA